MALWLYGCRAVGLYGRDRWDGWESVGGREKTRNG